MRRPAGPARGITMYGPTVLVGLSLEGVNLTPHSGEGTKTAWWQTQTIKLLREIRRLMKM